MNTDKHVTKNTEYKYKDLTGEILSCAFEVHNSLGCGFLEKVYERALIQELTARGLHIAAQKSITVAYKGQQVGTYIADLIVEDKVIVELKVVNFLNSFHRAQTINYLRASGYGVALMLNFSKPRLEYKRVVV